MAEIKTKATQVSVDEFLNAVENPMRRADGTAVCDMMRRVTGYEPTMWGPSIIGFGSYRYRYDSGHEGVMCRLGFSPRKAELVLYVLTGDDDEPALLARLGKHRIGKSCLYIKTLADIDTDILEQIMVGALAHMDARYPRD